MTVPSYSFLWSEEDVFAGHFRRYALKDISKVLESAGFQVEYSSYIFRFLPIPIFLFRMLPYKMGLKKAKRNMKRVSRDHGEKGGVMAKLLSSIFNCEIENLNSKKVMRFGGSCLVVAKCS